MAGHQKLKSVLLTDRTQVIAKKWLVEFIAKYTSHNPSRLSNTNRQIAEKDEVIGKYATADLKVGDYILASKLSHEPAAENAYLYNLDGTKQAISVTMLGLRKGENEYT